MAAKRGQLSGSLASEIQRELPRAAALANTNGTNTVNNSTLDLGGQFAIMPASKTVLPSRFNHSNVSSSVAFGTPGANTPSHLNSSAV